MPITIDSVDFEWPNGSSLFKGLSLSLEAGRSYGLVGPNGVGKSSLVRLLLGDLEPTRGEVRSDLQIACLPQRETPPALSVGELLQDPWSTLEHRDRQAFEALWQGLDPRTDCRDLSGGEWTRARLLRQLASRWDLLVLDEPTNNLDAEARQVVLDFVRQCRRGLLVISHDRALLRQVGTVLELSGRGLSVYGGGWDFYEAERDRERKRLAEGFETAKAEVAKAERERRARLHAQEKRMRQGRKNAPDSGIPKILLGAMKRRAEQTLGKLSKVSDDQVQARSEELRAAAERLKADRSIYAEIPQPELHQSRLVAEAEGLQVHVESSGQALWREPLSWSLHGPQRVALRGPNGSGKSTLLSLLAGKPTPGLRPSGRLKLGGLVTARIDQRGSVLADDRSVFDAVRAVSPRPDREIRNLLARFLFPGATADVPVGRLSSGERLRAALARVLLQQPVPQLLILDEPTNDLDLNGVRYLEGALAGFQGALIVVSHDPDFIAALGVHSELELVRASLRRPGQAPT